jgi:hypothetical protein
MPPATAGWQQWAGKPQPQIAIHRTDPDSFFFLSLPLMKKQPNYTCMLKNLLKLYYIWTWDTSWVFCFVLFYFSPLMRQLQNNNWGTISRIGGWGTNTKIIKTETSLNLNLENFYLLICLFIYLYFIYFLIFNLILFIYIFFHLLIFYFYSYLYSFYFLFSILSLTL